MLTPFLAPFLTHSYTDTTILIMSYIRYPLVGPGSGAELKLGQPLDPRGAIAIARTAVLHSHYKITNDDMLCKLGGPRPSMSSLGGRSHLPRDG